MQTGVWMQYDCAVGFLLIEKEGKQLAANIQTRGRDCVTIDLQELLKPTFEARPNQKLICILDLTSAGYKDGLHCRHSLCI